MVRVANRIALAHDLVEQRSFGAFPQGNFLAHLAVEQAKVVLHLAEVGQQFSGELLKLLEAVLDRCVVQRGRIAGQNAGDLHIELISLLTQVVDSFDRISLGASANLLQQRKQRQQA